MSKKVLVFLAVAFGIVLVISGIIIFYSVTGLPEDTTANPVTGSTVAPDTGSQTAVADVTFVPTDAPTGEGESRTDVPETGPSPITETVPISNPVTESQNTEHAVTTRTSETVTLPVKERITEFITTTSSPVTTVTPPVTTVAPPVTTAAEPEVTSEACNHAYVESVLIDATCISSGMKKRTCSKCGAEETESIPPLGHTYGDYTITKEPTHSNPGEKTATCSVCGNKVTVSIAWEHQYILTQHADGVVIYENGYCSVVNYGESDPYSRRYDICSVDQYECRYCSMNYLVFTGSNGETYKVINQLYINELRGGIPVWNCVETPTICPPVNFAWKTATWTDWTTIRQGNGIDVGKIEQRTCNETGDIRYRFTTIEGGLSWEGENLNCQELIGGPVHLWRVNDTATCQVDFGFSDFRKNVTLDMVPSVRMDNSKSSDNIVTVIWKEADGSNKAYTWSWYDDMDHSSVINFMYLYIYENTISATSLDLCYQLPTGEQWE